MKEILLATKNINKQRELQELLKDQDIKVLSLIDLNDDFDVLENGNSYFENAYKKARYYFIKYHYPTLADDSGIEVYKLNKSPGINSKRYSNNNDISNIEKLLNELKGQTNRKAVFKTSLVLYTSLGYKEFKGKLKGYISNQSKGSQGFGYDSIFIPSKNSKTIAELGMDYKNKHSHRKIAVDKFIKYLKNPKLLKKVNLENLALDCIDFAIFQKAKIVKRLMGGMSNYTYVFDLKLQKLVDKQSSKKYTLRVPGEKAEMFVNRVIEKQNIEKIKHLGLNSPVIYLNVDTGLKINEYIDGVSLNETNYTNHLQDIAKTIKILHESKIKAVNDIDLVERIYNFSLIGDKDNKDFIELFDFFKKVYKIIDNKDEYCFIHGDMQPSNFVLSNDRLYLLDWEFSGNQSFYYDIACFGNKNLDDAINLLPYYLLRKPNIREINRVKFYRFQQTLQWFQVASYKHKIGLSEKLNIPFDVVAKKYIELAKKLKEELNNLDWI